MLEVWTVCSSELLVCFICLLVLFFFSLLAFVCGLGVIACEGVGELKVYSFLPSKELCGVHLPPGMPVLDKRGRIA